MWGDMHDPRGVRLDQPCQLVDAHVTTGPGVDHAPDDRICRQGRDDEPRAVVDVQQIARLGAVTVDPERLPEDARG
jgi:hypothetical protein